MNNISNSNYEFKNFSERNFARLIDSCIFERTMLADQKLSTVLKEFPVSTKGIFKDSYILDFLDLPDNYNEADLQHALIKHLKKFLLEMGPDFTFIGEEYVVQVGNKDFRIDLLMHHRGLNCLTAIELKVAEFLPEYIGKMQFYLEALDRKVKNRMKIQALVPLSALPKMKKLLNLLLVETYLQL